MNREKFGFKPNKEKVREEINAGIIEHERETKNSDAENISEDILKQKELKETGEILEESNWLDIYNNYAEAIQRRNREPLGAESFYNHFFSEGSFDKTFAYGDKAKGYLLGSKKFNIFIPTHFAPKSLRGGYELMQELGESQGVPSVMAITEDLGRTLDKMPSWQKLKIDEVIMAYFKGELVKKEIYFNSHPMTQGLMAGLLMEYMNNNYNNRSDYDRLNKDDDFDDGE